MIDSSALDDNPRFDEALRKMVAAWGCDINEPYSPLEYMKDLQLVVTSAPDARDPKGVWRDPETGEQYVFTVNADHFLLRIYQQLTDRYGPKKGFSRALRCVALMAFRQRYKNRLNASELDWMDPACGTAERKLDWLNFLLQYPVPQSKQFSPEAIPVTAIGEFLISESRTS